MAPFGDVAPALELCRVASGGAGLDVVRPLALETVTRIVPAEIAVWTDVDIARGGAATTVVLPRGADGGWFGVAGPEVRPIEVDEGDAISLELAAPAGHRAAIGLWRDVAFSDEECERLERIGPVIGCAVLAAWRAPAADPSGVLTRREAAVLRSVATGMSDKQAARALGVSPRTVGKHLEHIYAKLGVGGRMEAAALINRSG